METSRLLWLSACVCLPLLVACGADGSSTSKRVPEAIGTGDPTSPTSGPSGTTPSGTAAGTTPQTNTGTTVPGSSKCEELGALEADGVAAAMDEVEQWFWGGLASRPGTRVGVIGTNTAAVGVPTTLGVGAQSDWATCTHCLAVVVGCNGADCSTGTWFVASGGTARFDAVATRPGEAFTSQFDDVILEQVAVDPKTHHSTVVPNGGCFHVTSASFSAITQAAAEGGTPGGGSDGDGGTGSTSSDHGGRGGGTGMGGAAPYEEVPL